MKEADASFVKLEKLKNDFDVQVVLVEKLVVDTFKKQSDLKVCFTKTNNESAEYEQITSHNLVNIIMLKSFFPNFCRKESMKSSKLKRKACKPFVSEAQI